MQTQQDYYMNLYESQTWTYRLSRNLQLFQAVLA